MFSVHCPDAGAEILLGPRRILSMHNTSEGVVSYFRCRCGTLGVIVSGRASLTDRVYHPSHEVELEELAPLAVSAA